EDVRPFSQLIDRSGELPNPVTAKRVVFGAEPKFCRQCTVLRCPHLAMVQQNLFSECPRFPTLQASRHDGNVIYATPFHRPVSTNLFVAFATAELAHPRHTPDAKVTTIVCDAALAFERGSNQT